MRVIEPVPFLRHARGRGEGAARGFRADDQAAALHVLLGREGRVAALLVTLPLRVGEEPALGDGRGHDRRQDNDCDEERELGTVEIPALSPKTVEIVPNVSPVLISSVEKAWRGAARRASG
jgi:hypothetical protein